MRSNSKLNLFIFSTLVAIFTVGTTSCGDDDSDVKPNPPVTGGDTTGTDTTIIPVDTASYLDLMGSHLWVLHETYQDGNQTTAGGTDRYEYTYDGAFLFESSQGWVQIGGYSWAADSAAINTRFSGTSNAIFMKLEVLSEDSLHTRFTTNGSEFLYKYHKD